MTILLAFHILLMSASLVATSGIAIAAVASIRVNPQLVRFNLAGTCTGIATGIVLLVQHPIGTKCAALFTYVVAFTVAYAYVCRKNQLLATSEA